MRKRFLTRLNILLGAVSMTLAGCHSQKAVTNPQPAEPAQPTPAVEPGEVICLYGVPREVYERQQMERRDSVPPEQLDSVPEVMLKYGVPRPRPKKEPK